MSQVPDAHHDSTENGGHHSNVSDDSRASLIADLEPSIAKDRAEEKRLEILIHSDSSKPVKGCSLEEAMSRQSKYPVPQTWHIPVLDTFASVEHMNLQDISNQIDAEIVRLKQVKALMAGIGMSGGGGKKSVGKRTMSAGGRARIVAAQRKRWAAVHKAARHANRKKLPDKTKPPTLTTKA